MVIEIGQPHNIHFSELDFRSILLYFVHLVIFFICHLI